MSNLFIFNEYITNGYKPEILDILYLVSILFGIFVIISKNPIVSVLFLIGLFFTISCYLILLGISFIGISYLLVYVGAISILFLFILMLINVRISELLSDTSNSLPLAIIIGIMFNYAVFLILPYNITTFNNFIFQLEYTFKNIIDIFENIYKNNNTDYTKFSTLSFKDETLFVTSNIWDGNLAEATHISSIGNILYTNYSIWLILASIILLLAMVGCIVITIKPRN